MSRLDSSSRSRGIPDETPQADIFTVLLGVALAAILIAILCLALELGRYAGQTRPSGYSQAPTAPLLACAQLPAAESRL